MVRIVDIRSPPDSGLPTPTTVDLVATTTREGPFSHLPTRSSWTFDPLTGVLAIACFARSHATIAAALRAGPAAWALAPRDARRLARISAAARSLSGTLLAWAAAYTAMSLVART